MSFLYKFSLKKILIIVSITASVILMLNISILLIKNVVANNLYESEAREFLSYVESGDVHNSSLLWPAVYAHSKENDTFLNEFSNTLDKIYIKYYINSYLEKNISENYYNLSRQYFSFYDEDNFNSLTSNIYDDYLCENISTLEFKQAINDYFLFSEYTSAHITILLDKAFVIEESRSNFEEAEKMLLILNYSSAVDFYNLVSPKDYVYYPIAQKKITTCIYNLKEEVKNGS